MQAVRWQKVFFALCGARWPQGCPTQAQGCSPSSGTKHALGKWRDTKLEAPGVTAGAAPHSTGTAQLQHGCLGRLPLHQRLAGPYMQRGLKCSTVSSQRASRHLHCQPYGQQQGEDTGLDLTFPIRSMLLAALTPGWRTEALSTGPQNSNQQAVRPRAWGTCELCLGRLAPSADRSSSR